MPKQQFKKACYQSKISSSNISPAFRKVPTFYDTPNKLRETDTRLAGYS